MEAPYSRLSSAYLAWLLTRDSALSKMSATNLYTSSSATSSRARITAPTATVVVSVRSTTASPLLLSLPPPQATRLRAMTSARINAKNFFMVYSPHFIVPRAAAKLDSMDVLYSHLLFFASQNDKKFIYPFCGSFTRRWRIHFSSHISPLRCGFYSFFPCIFINLLWRTTL